MDDYAPSRYKLIKRIGEGVHGVVIRAIDLTTNKDVAIKKISLRTRHGDLSINAIREIKVLQYCEHRNVNQFFLHFLYWVTRILNIVDSVIAGHISGCIRYGTCV